MLDAISKEQDPTLLLLFGQLMSQYPDNESLDHSEFSLALSKLEKKLLQFGLGSTYLVGFRNLNEFTLALKRQKAEGSEEDNELNVNDEQFDSTTNLNMISDLVRRVKTSPGVLSRREIQAVELLQMNYNIIQSEFESLRLQN